MAKSKKRAAYVVILGRIPGVYVDWKQCEIQISGFPGAVFQGYNTIELAETAWEEHLKSITPTGAAYAAAHPNGTVPKPLELFNPKEDRQRGMKRPLEDPAIDLTSSSPVNAESAEKKQRTEETAFQNIGNFASSLLQTVEISSPAALPPNDKPVILEEEEEERIELTDAQEAVVSLALQGYNIFLTGAAGSGKTVTLKEIIRRLESRYPTAAPKHIPRVQVIAPTGIAALPLNGRTTFSFAGWNPDSLQKPMEELFEGVKATTITAVTNLQVLIIEEVSMVENQFLDRLNRLFQYILFSNLPFGGKQVLFVGDFHQLPPVKPFQYCVECGEPMTRQGSNYKCKAETPQYKRACHKSTFVSGDKWAFKARAWTELHLRHVKLEQIHRQKETRFQNILNKLRNGLLLDDHEWDELEKPKDLPKGAFAVRLMSRLNQVNRFNEMELEKLKTEEKSWVAYDTCVKKFYEESDKFPPRSTAIAAKVKEFREALKDHRFQTELKLKIGAKVVLLHNLNPKLGLVNGTQGQVIGFANSESWPDKSEGHWKQMCSMDFTSKNGYFRPIVKFANGKTQAIPHIIHDSTKISGQDRYLVSRSQIPLTLAWALSIHKSQGMTLQYAEVSSRDIFETGQLYVGVSRVTTMDGLIVTGFSREKTEMDTDVLEFYNKTEWENLGPSNAPRSSIKAEEKLPEKAAHVTKTVATGSAPSQSLRDREIIEILDSDDEGD